MRPCSHNLIVMSLVVKLIGAWFLDSELSTCWKYNLQNVLWRKFLYSKNFWLYSINDKFCGVVDHLGDKDITITMYPHM